MTMAWSWVRVSCLVLLFSGCLAAVVNKETPEALVAPEDITYFKLTLNSFTWNAAAKEAGREAGPYESLEVCYEEPPPENLAALGDGDKYTLVYNNTAGTLMVFGEGSPSQGLQNKCVTFTNGDTDVPIPSGPVTYRLHIANADDATEKEGAATFAVDAHDYEGGSRNVDCGGATYTRTTVADPKTCTGAGGVSAGDTICYTTVTERKDEPDLDTNGCIENDEGINVCLSDKGSATAEGTIVVNSLTYPVAPATEASLDITYTPKGTPAKTLEFLMQDSAEPPTLLYAGACDDPAAGGSCTTAVYTQQVNTYQVCAVGVGTDADVVVSYTLDTGIITDLNLVGIPVDDTKTIEFGFSNAMDEDNMFYHASVTDGTNDPVKVGINCNGVTQSNTCYGFLDISGQTSGDTLVLTVEFGAENEAGGVEGPYSNTIIGTYTNLASSTPAPPNGGPQVEE